MAARGKVARWLAGMAVLCASTASAADIASFQPLGFSPDGSIFAFEEFGIQDGSGFPYSNVYFIDTNADRYLSGTPIRVRIDADGANLGTARDQARQQAVPLIGKYALTAQPGLLAAFNPVTEVDAPAHRIRYLPHAVIPAFGSPYTLVLEEISQPPAEPCKGLTESSAAFRLKLVERDGKPENETVYEDVRLPESRRCATGYRLGGIMTYHPLGGATVHVALVLVMSYGFEGSDGRWIAIPIKL